MHTSAMLRMKWFVENYIPKDSLVRVLDVGSCDVNGSFKSLFNNYKAEYVGLDMSPGKNVTYVPKDAYSWDELEDESFDFIISGNAFEHIEFPWLTIREMYKKLRHKGFACILVPFSLGEHRYPVDCYRYFPDGMRALAKWGGFKVVEASLGGVPQGTSDPQWYSTSLNYDDTVGILAKVDSEEELQGLPKFNYSNVVNIWKAK